jgi:hypothetical protein
MKHLMFLPIALCVRTVVIGRGEYPGDWLVVRPMRGDVTRLPLYTRHLMRHGRGSHMEIGNKEMVGCFRSHVAAWKLVKGETLVLEEDAGEADLSIVERPPGNWSVLFLIGRSMDAGWADAQEVADGIMGCDSCRWLGTRAYLITEAGALLLLEHARREPMVVQVDSFIGLVNEFDERFKMYWTRETVVGNRWPLWSTVWDGCLRCYMWEAVVVLAFLVFFLVTSGLGKPLKKPHYART